MFGKLWEIKEEKERALSSCLDNFSKRDDFFKILGAAFVSAALVEWLAFGFIFNKLVLLLLIFVLVIINLRLSSKPNDKFILLNLFN